MKLIRLKAIAAKEVLQVVRDPRSLLIALLMPFMQMFLLGYGMSLDISHIPLCTLDREVSPLSIELLNRFQSSQYFSSAKSLSNDRDLKTAIDEGICEIAIVIPPDFSERLSATGHGAIQAIVDATNNNTASIAIGYTQAVIGGFSSSIQAQFIGPVAILPPFSIQSRVWFNEDLESRNFIIPGAVALIMALVGAQLTSLTIAREWERGTMELLVSTPVTPMEVMLGKLIPYFFIGLLDAVFCLLMAVFWFSVPFRGTVMALLVMTMLFLVVVLGIGYMISVAIRNQLGASQIALLVTMLPTTILSGMSFPIDQMPSAVRAISYIVYGRYYVTAIKAIFLKGSGLSELSIPLVMMAIYAAGIGFFASRAFRKSLE